MAQRNEALGLGSANKIELLWHKIHYSPTGLNQDVGE
jgi:hypothetical protein